MENKKIKFTELPTYQCKTDFGTYNIKIIRTKYMNNDSIALILFEADTGEEFAVITVNIEDGVANGNMAYLDTNNCRWVENFVKTNKLGKSLNRYGWSGFCRYPLYEIYIDKIIDEEVIDWGE